LVVICGEPTIELDMTLAPIVEQAEMSATIDKAAF
jgi:hypothetical protein